MPGAGSVYVIATEAMGLAKQDQSLTPATSKGCYRWAKQVHAGQQVPAVADMAGFAAYLIGQR